MPSLIIKLASWVIESYRAVIFAYCPLRILLIRIVIRLIIRLIIRFKLVIFTFYKELTTYYYLLSIVFIRSLLINIRLILGTSSLNSIQR